MRRFDARGSAIIPALSVVTILALLSTLSLLAGGSDLLLAKRFARERAAFHAAEAGLETVRAELRAGGLVPEESFHPPWPPPSISERSWREEGWDISRDVRAIPDVRDVDGDPATTTVLYNRRFGFAGSSRETGGFPVFQVLVAARSGGTRQAVVAEVTPVVCAPRVPAAWLAGGPLSLSGPIALSGALHALDGAALPGAEHVPAAISSGAVLLTDGATTEGLGCFGDAAVVCDASTPVPAGPLAALNSGDSLRRLEDLPAPPAEGGLNGVVWSRGDYAGGLDGAGILVVHNPAFDPERHEASRLALEEGIVTTSWDASYSHLDPARRPARLEVVRGGRFRGVIVADSVGACEQDFALVGALITLSRSPMAVAARAPFNIRYSPAAAAAGGRGPLAHLTAFRPLPGIPGRVE